MVENDEILDEDFDKWLMALPTELNSWLDKDYLNQIAKDLVNLTDFIPLTIELLLPDYNARKRFLFANMHLICDDEYDTFSAIDSYPTDKEQYASIYDLFFERHPEFLGLIKDKQAYEEWKLDDNVDFIDDGPYELKNEYSIEDYFDINDVLIYREKIYKFVQEKIIPKYSQITSCDMEILPEDSAWDIDLRFLQEDDISLFKVVFKGWKDNVTLEKEIRKALMSFCKEIGAEEYYLFISMIVDANFLERLNKKYGW